MLTSLARMGISAWRRPIKKDCDRRTLEGILAGAAAESGEPSAIPIPKRPLGKTGQQVTI